MIQWGFYFNQVRCIGCKGCMFACKAWNDDKRGDRHINPWLSWLDTGKYATPSEYENLPGSTGEQNYAEYRKYYMKEKWMSVKLTEYGDAPPNVDVLNMIQTCFHCDKPSCVEVCPVNIIYKEPEYGVVLVSDEEACISCGRCINACPWGSPQFYDFNYKNYAQDDPKRPKMTKCTLCLDRIREGLKPACVAGCLTRALDAGPIDELKARYPSAVTNAETFASDAWTLGDKSGHTVPNIIFKPKTRRV